MDPQPPQTPPARIEQKLFNVRILYAEDDDDVREDVESMLEGQCSSVEVVSNGAELMERLSAPGADYDLIISDNNMPGKKGIEALQEIRHSNKKWKNIPFILLTGEQGKKGEVEELEGIFMLKPPKKDLLHNVIEGVLKLKELQKEIANSATEIEREFTKGSGASWLACVATRLTVIDFALLEEDIKKLLTPEQYEKATLKMQKVKKRLNEFRQQFGAGDVPEEIKKELIQALNIL
jgi:CheY-like chemotaxis protein